MSEPTKKRKRIKQFIITFTPFFILTLLFIGLNFWPGWLNQFYQPTVTATVEEINTLNVNGALQEPNFVEVEQIESGTAVIPTSTPQSTPSPQPTLPPEAMITLSGPPQASIFSDTSLVTFYWNWPLPSTDNQQFILTVFNGSEVQQIATISEQNLGQQYALTIDLETIKPAKPESPLVWQIQLINSESGEILTQSEQREFSLISQAKQQ